MADTQKKNNIRCYSWSLIIYDDKSTILSAINTNNDIISEYALSPLHQFDGKEPHYHLLIVFKREKSLSCIAKTFNLSQNLFGEKLKDKYLAYRYLTHKDDKDKYQYDENEIVCSDVSYFTQRDQEDTSTEKNLKYLSLLDDINKGLKLREMIIKYGRDFIIHYHNFREMAELLKREEDLLYGLLKEFPESMPKRAYYDAHESEYQANKLISKYNNKEENDA